MHQILLLTFKEILKKGRILQLFCYNNLSMTDMGVVRTPVLEKGTIIFHLEYSNILVIAISSHKYQPIDQHDSLVMAIIGSKDNLLYIFISLKISDC